MKHPAGIPIDVDGAGAAYARVLDAGVGDAEPEVLGRAIVAAMLLARERILALADQTAPHGRAEESPPVVLLREASGRALSDRSLRPLDELLDWWHRAYLGAPLTGAFTTGNHLPRKVRAALTSAADGQPWPLRDIILARRLDAVLGSLETEIAARRRGHYNDATPAIYLDAAEAYAAALRRGEEPDPAWVGADPARLVRSAVARDSRYQDGPYFAKLTKVEIPTLQALGAEAERLRPLRTEGAPSPPLPGGLALPEPFGPVLGAAALDLAETRTEEVAEALDALAAELAAAPGSARARVGVARSLADLGREERWVADTLQPLQDIEREAQEVALALPDGVELDIRNWLEELDRAIADGDPTEAREWLDMLRTEVARESSRLELTRQLERLQDRIAGMDDAATHDARSLLDGARTLIAEEKFFAARRMLRTAAADAGLLALQAEVSPPPRQDPDPEPDRDGGLADMQQRERFARDLYERGEVDRARAELERLVVEQPRSPGTYLLLKIYGRDGQVGVRRSLELLEALRAQGAVRNQHHVVTARMAIAAGMRDAAEQSIASALELNAPPQDIGRLSAAYADRFDEPPELVHGEGGHTLITAVDSGVADSELEALADALAGTGNALEVERTAGAIVGARADVAVRLLERALEAVPRTGRPRLWHRLIEALRADGQADAAERVAAISRPPLPVAGAEVRPPAPGAEVLEARPSSIIPSGGMPPEIKALVAEAADAPPHEAARLLTKVADAGFVIGYGAAIAAFVAAGRPVDALDLYARVAERVYATPAIVWNVGCAYAHLGDVERALASFRLLAQIVDTMEPAQRRSVRAFFAANDADLVEIDAATPAGTASVEESNEIAAESRRRYEAGDVAGALVLARRLAEVQPNHPGVLILFKIYRERGDVAAAERLVDELDRGGYRHWRPSVELARVAIDAGDTACATRALGVAHSLGAQSAWTDPLEARLTRAGVDHSYGTAALVHEEAGVPGILRGGTTLDPANWARYVRARAAADELESALADAERVVERYPWTALAPVEAVADGARVDATEAKRRLIALTARSGSRPALELLTHVLLSAGEPEAAAELLGAALTALDRYEPPYRPRISWRLAEVLRERGDHARAREVLLEAAPPIPDDPLPEPAPVESSLVPEVLLLHLAGPSVPPAVLSAQRLADADADPAEVARAWLVAVRETGFPAALAAALGHLVLAGRPDTALELFRERFAQQWLDWRATWNIGCAYAARGHLQEAAEAFLLHGRIAPQPLTEDRREARDRILLRVGETPPADPAPAAAVPQPAGGPGDEPRVSLVLLAQLEESGTETDFVRAVRRLPDLVDVGALEWREALERAERWYERFEPPGPESVAAIARLRAAAGDSWRGWAEVWRWLQTHEVHNTVLDTAVALARDVGRVRDLLGRLSAVRSRTAAVEHAMAKLAEQDGDHDRMLRHAQEAHRLSPSWSEAEGTLARARLAAAPERSPEAVADADPAARPSREPADAIFALAALLRSTREAGGDALGILRSRSGEFLTAFHLDTAGFLKTEAAPLPEGEREGGKLGPVAVAAMDRGLERAGRSDWDGATEAFGQAFDSHPRSTHAVWNLCVSLMNAGHFAKARRIAATMRYSLRGARLLAAMDVRQENPASAAEHLDRIARRLPRRHEVALARAGILYFWLEDKRGAGDALLESARRGLPGLPHRHLVLAILVALETGEEPQANALLDELLAPVPDTEEVVDWVCEHDRVEVLGQPAVLGLGLELDDRAVERLVRHFVPDRTDDLIRMLTSRVFDRPVPERACVGALLRVVAERRAATTELAVLRRMAEELPELRDEALARHAEICLENDYADGWRERIDELGVPRRAEDEARILEMERASAERAVRHAERLQAVAPSGAFTDLPAVRASIHRLVPAMREAAEGTADARAVELLAGLWERELDCIEAFPDERAQREFLAVDGELRKLQGTLLSRDLNALTKKVGPLLYQPWEELARTALVPHPLKLELVRASRVPEGPLEVVVVLRAELDVTEIRVAVHGPTVSGSGRTLSRLGAGASHEVCVVAAVAQRLEYPITIEAQSERGAGAVDRAVIHLDEGGVLAPAAGVTSLFGPYRSAHPQVFRGRADKRAEIARKYGPNGERTVWFLEGPRQIGKSSLLTSLTRFDDGWAVPSAIPVYVHCGAEKPRSTAEFFGAIAENVKEQVDECAAAGVIAPASPVEGPAEELRPRAFLKWCRRLVGGLGGPRLVILLDEVQSALRGLPEGDRTEVLNAIRYQNGDHGDALVYLLSGSCTLSRLLELMRGSELPKEVRALKLGLIDEETAVEVFRAGLPDAHVLPEAASRLWLLSGGHPNWIHLVGAEVRDQLETRGRRVVDEEIVERAASNLAAEPSLLDGAVNLTAEGPDATGTLIELADEFRGGPSPRQLELVLARFPAASRSERRKQIEEFVHMGLMRFVQEGTAVGWTNELLWRALLAYADRETQRGLTPANGSDPYAPLREFGEPHPIPESTAVRIGNDLVAKPVTTRAVEPIRDLVETVPAAEVFGLLGQFPANFPDYVARREGEDQEWHVFKWVAGRTLLDEVKLRRKMRSGDEPSRDFMPARVLARVIEGAADRLTFAYKAQDGVAGDAKPSLTHGDVKPANIVVQADDTAVLIDWDSATIDEVPTLNATGTRGFMSPAYQQALNEGRGASHADDVFALGVTLYQALTGVLPYGNDVPAARPGQEPPQEDIDDSLWPIVKRACALDESERYRSTDDLARALRSWAA